MVFRRLFGSRERRSSENLDTPGAPTAPVPVSPSTELDSEFPTTLETPYASAETINSYNDQLPQTRRVELTAIPDCLLEAQPELKLSEYDMCRGQYARNVLALTHNAARLEMADMLGDILPSLQLRSEQVSSRPLTRDDLDDLREWWSGFARYVLTASLVEDKVVKKAFAELYVGFDRDLQAMDKLYKRAMEKNNVSLEMAVRKMDKAVQDFEKDNGAASFTSLGTAWQALSSTLSSIYADTERLIDMIDTWIQNPFEYKDLERQATKIFTNKKRWGEDDAKRGEMIIILCRWLGTEDLMREWMQRNLTKRELRSADKWMDEYRDKRLAIVDRFHQKKV